MNQKMAGPLNLIAKHSLNLLIKSSPPTPGEQASFSSWPGHPWNVRTLIAPLSVDSPVELLFANVFIGTTGVKGFDNGIPGGKKEYEESDEVNVAILALGEKESLRWTGTILRKDGAKKTDGGFKINGRGLEIDIGGGWPDYNQQLRIPHLSFNANIEVKCVAPVHWWARGGKHYSHNSAFGTATGQVKIGKETAGIKNMVSIESGFGRNLLKLPGSPSIPATVFHYELGSLQGAGLFALGTFRIGNFEPFRSGVIVSADGSHYAITKWHSGIGKTVHIPDKLGGTIEVPSVWVLEAHGPDVHLYYEAESPWLPVAGVGRLTSGGARTQGMLSITGSPPVKFRAVLYQEHLTATCYSLKDRI